jgi:hypothetical protein
MKTIVRAAAALVLATCCFACGQKEDAPASSMTTTSSTPADQTDHYVTTTVAHVTERMIAFLWNRDLNPNASTQVSASEGCWLSGTYDATGTRTTIDASCHGNGALDVDYVLHGCEHPGALEGETVVFDGTIHEKFSGTYEGSCAEPVTTSETLAGAALRVTFVRRDGAGEVVFQRAFEACDIELDYEASSTNRELAGRTCGLPVDIDYGAP